MIADGPEILKKAKALDDMEKSVSSEEADVLERVLQALSDGKKPKIIDVEKIESMYNKYLERSEDGGGASTVSGEDDAEYPIDEEMDL